MGSRNSVAGPVRGWPWEPWRDTELAEPRAVKRSPPQGEKGPVKNLGFGA